MATDVKFRAVRGSVFLAGSTFAVKIISVLATIYLARILDPADFGLYGLATVVLAYAGLFSTLGIPSAVIQNPGDRSSVAYHGFVATTGLGFLFGLVVFISAPVIAEGLDAPAVVGILRWLTAIVFLDSLSRIPESLLQKDLLFGRVGLGSVIPEILNLATALGCALAGFGVMSLVYGVLIRALSRVVLYWMLSPNREWIHPKPWDRNILRGLVQYGSQLTAGGFVYFMNSSVGNLLVGKFLGTTALGYYGKAYDFANTSIGSLTAIIGSVLFPSYAKMQSEPVRLKSAYIRGLRVISLVIMPLGAGMIVVAPDAVPLLIGAKWVPMVVPLQIMAGVFLLVSLSMTTSTLFQATGHPEINVRAGIFVTVVMLPFMILALFSGVVAVACSVLFGQIFGFFYNARRMNRVLPGSLAEMPRALTPSVVSSGIMVAGVYLLRMLFVTYDTSASGLFWLGVMVAAGGVLYMMALKVLYTQSLMEILDLVKGALAKKKREISGVGGEKG